MDVGFIFTGVSIMAKVYTQDELDNAVEAAVTKERARAAAAERLYRDMLETRDRRAASAAQPRLYLGRRASFAST